MAESNLRQRVMEPEDIDDPALEKEQLFSALRGLTTINFLSASAGSVWKPMVRLARERKQHKLRILDVATGGGDIPRALWRKGKQAGLKLEILGVDISERALEFAAGQCRDCGNDVRFEQRDILLDGLPEGFDVIVSSLFLHHLTNDQAGQLLAGAATATRHLVLINDLRRGKYGLTLAYLAGHLLSSSPVVRVDAIRSVRAAFTMQEALAMAQAAGMKAATVERRWPARYLLQWRKAASPT
ncbi:MAG: methyltransferase domain-containing protein [Pirellulaceae bacterium]